MSSTVSTSRRSPRGGRLLIAAAAALLFRDRCGRSFIRYEGAWRLSEQNGQTVIDYELTAKPSFDVPGWMLKRVVRRDSAEMIGRLQREIAGRASPFAPQASR